ncbi:MAG TPA: UDP-N-acetylmuramoyl-tripeptide--D-alanyl-D-alanine ligase, partial [Limnochordia bacterium]|nr:UDP-N-acetylmuramoyl-tripeptide--D-alanyl-D-alanine ligase [Limnochordia bacterium]
MRPLTLQQIATITQGKAVGEGIVTNVQIDSREATPGSLFVALPGTKLDGHLFVSDVVAQGGFALVKEGLYEGPGVVQVADPLQALQELARAYLAKFPVPVVAITGSNGKTSTKDMITQVLSIKYSVHATEGNFNNEIGVPLTVLGLEEHHDLLVVEMGMRGLGQIRRLTEISPPNFGVITNIGPVHLELLGGMGNIAQAKGELLEGMGFEGVAILNGDDPSVRGQARNFKGRVVYYGLDVANDVVGRGINLDVEGRPTFTIRYEQQEIQVRLAVPGVHNVWNASAALAVGLQFDIDMVQGAEALTELAASAMRLEVQRSPSGVIVVNDSYNASPGSMEGALDTLGHMYCSGKRVAILGDMLELGDVAEEAHIEVGRHAVTCANDVVFIGQYAPFMREGAGRGDVYASVDDFLVSGEMKLESGDLVLVKASRGLHFERIAEKLLK